MKLAFRMIAISLALPFLAISGCGTEASDQTASGNQTGSTAPVTATAPGSSFGSTVSVPVPATVEIIARGDKFIPDDITIDKGTTVKWINEDPYSHTVTADDGLFDSGLAKGATFEFTFDEAGTFPYTCTIHANMEGSIAVK